MTISTENGKPRVAWAEASEDGNSQDEVQDQANAVVETAKEAAAGSAGRGTAAAKYLRAVKPSMVIPRHGKLATTPTPKAKPAPTQMMQADTRAEDQRHAAAESEDGGATLAQVLQQLMALTAQLSAKDEIIATLTAELTGLRAVVSDLQSQLQLGAQSAGGDNSR